MCRVHTLLVFDYSCSLLVQTTITTNGVFFFFFAFSGGPRIAFGFIGNQNRDAVEERFFFFPNVTDTVKIKTVHAYLLTQFKYRQQKGITGSTRPPSYFTVRPRRGGDNGDVLLLFLLSGFFFSLSCPLTTFLPLTRNRRNSLKYSRLRWVYFFSTFYSAFHPKPRTFFSPRAPDTLPKG